MKYLLVVTLLFVASARLNAADSYDSIKQKLVGTWVFNKAKTLALTKINQKNQEHLNEITEIPNFSKELTTEGTCIEKHGDKVLNNLYKVIPDPDGTFYFIQGGEASDQGFVFVAAIVFQNENLILTPIKLRPSQENIPFVYSKKQ